MAGSQSEDEPFQLFKNMNTREVSDDSFRQTRADFNMPKSDLGSQEKDSDEDSEEEKKPKKMGGMKAKKVIDPRKKGKGRWMSSIYQWYY